MTLKQEIKQMNEIGLITSYLHITCSFVLLQDNLI